MVLDVYQLRLKISDWWHQRKRYEILC